MSTISPETSGAIFTSTSGWILPVAVTSCVMFVRTAFSVVTGIGFSGLRDTTIALAPATTSTITTMKMISFVFDRFGFSCERATSLIISDSHRAGRPETLVYGYSTAAVPEGCTDCSVSETKSAKTDSGISAERHLSRDRQPRYHPRMPCDHIGAPELIELAEERLRADGVATEAWPGRRFGFGQNLDGAMWASVQLEIERRGDQWIVTRIDRNREPLPESETGFRSLAPSAEP